MNSKAMCDVHNDVHPSKAPLLYLFVALLQLDQILMLQPAVDSDQHSVSTEAMQPQNKERAYRQKLLAYQEAQQRQVQLVQKLQTKVARNGSHSLDTSTRMP